MSETSILQKLTRTQDGIFLQQPRVGIEHELAAIVIAVWIRGYILRDVHHV